ncbi:hypothetical protein J3R30DRAFT_3406823 [Lentinula aciculospora]|uniref:BTB domain-containing protein n=1 Tax=Lentinula aciculospora TaxID=153920 RepID=A0A9W9A2N5_9AGAR|nr:hypothetical protein J3R30DRAFT_3406823 [Lentinula aciculospora]
MTSKTANLACKKSKRCAYSSLSHFNAPDADVVIRSSDNVEFHLHKKNLEFSTGAFPPAETPVYLNETVSLTESAATLDIMFQFVYPKRYPHLDKVKFEALMLLAEAAEKYEHPKRILEFAAMHDYRGTVEELAVILLDSPISDLVDILPSMIYKPWSIHREKWMVELQRAAQPPYGWHHLSCQWNQVVHEVQQQLKKPSDLKSPHLDGIFAKCLADHLGLKPCCTKDPEKWQNNIKASVNDIQPFVLS